MKINTLLKLHIVYLLNKTTYILLLLLSLFLITYFLMTSHAFYSYSDRWMNNYEYNLEYLYNGIGILKLIMPIIAIYICGNSFLEVNDNYGLLLIKDYKTKSIYYLSKILSINLLIFLICSIYYIFYIIIGYFFVISFNISCIIKSLIYVYYICLCYGLFSTIMSKITSKSLAYIFIIIFYIINEGITSYNDNGYLILSSFFPTLVQVGQGFNLSVSFSYINLLVIVYHLFSFIIYYKKEL